MGRGSFGLRELAQSVEKNDSAYGSRVVDVEQNRLDISSNYTPNTERHKLVVNGVEDRTFTSPNFANTPSKYQLTAADGDTVVFGSREQFRYVPSFESLFGIAAWYETAADTLTSGQRLFVELSDEQRDNVFGYEFTPGNTRVFIRSGGTLVDELPQSEWGEFPGAPVEAGDPFDHINRDQPLNPQGMIAWYGVGEFRPELNFTKSDGRQTPALLGHLSNQNDVTTEEISLFPKVVAAADAGAPEFTVAAGSIAAVIRGQATEFNRPRAAVFYQLGGAIGPEYANNVPLIAARHAPKNRNVNLKLDVPEFSPEGSVTIDLLVGAVGASDTDATGFATPEQGNAQNNAIQYTDAVTTFPTETRDTPTNGTIEVPDVRPLATSVAEGEKNDTAKASAGPGEENKRVLGRDEIALYIPRTAGSTDAALNWLRPINTQDW